MDEIMNKLITKLYYATKEEAQEKCDVFFAVGRITEDQYKDLTSLANKLYA